MKYIVLLIIGVISVATFNLGGENQASNTNNNTETSSITPVSEVKADTVKEPVKTVEKSADSEDKSTTESAPTEEVDVVKDNPQGCDRATEWIWSDGSCHKKEVAGSIAPSTTAPSSAKTSSSAGCELVYNYSNWNQNVAYAVCMAESGGNTYAANYQDHHNGCTGSFGLFQIACIHAGASFDPATNVAAANRIYSSSGWGPWGAYTSGAYYKFLR